jgi:putative ABC transport system permease protein
MSWIVQDLRYGLRGLRKQPSFTLLAIFALALGIGASTAIFSVIENVLLDPFPYVDTQRVISIVIHDLKSSRPGGRSWMKLAEYLEYQDHNQVFEEITGGGTEDMLYTNGTGGAEQFEGAYLTPNQFTFLGVPALYGRILTPEDAKPGAPPAFVMNYKVWSGRFNANRDLVGKTLILNNVPMTLVGIMPPRFTKRGADIYRVISLDRADLDNRDRYFALQARLKPGVSISEAQVDAELIARRLAGQFPDDYPKQFSVQIETWIDNFVGQFRKTLFTLAAAVGMLLLIACMNVANMLLARASAREKEMAVRASMGATRWRIVRQLLIESLLLAMGGAILGCVIAWAGLKAIVAFLPQGLIPGEVVIGLNTRVLLFTLGTAVLTALLFGLAPALQTAKRDIVEPLKDVGKGVSGGFRGGTLRNALVIAEVALSLVLLTAAGLLMRSFMALQTVDLGLEPTHVLVARVPLPRGQYKTAAQKQAFFTPLLQRVGVLPGVIAATATSTLPPYGGIVSEIEIPGKTHSERWDAIFQLVSDGYFRTLGIRLIRGRALSEVEVIGARKSAVINQTLATKYFGSEDPLGRSIKIKMLETMHDGPVANPVFEVVGIVADARNQGIQDPVRPEMFIAYTITGAFDRGILVRTAQDPHTMLNALREEIWAVDRNVATTLTGSLDDYLKRFSYAQPRFILILFGVFAGVGLLLVAIGIYSVIAYTVSRQTHEIGVRMALGAGRAHVLVMVLRMGLRMIAIGIGIGVLASLFASRALSTQVWGISVRDPLTMVTVVAVVLIAGIAACFFPAQRATRVDPMTALRYE